MYSIGDLGEIGMYQFDPAVVDFFEKEIIYYFKVKSQGD